MLQPSDSCVRERPRAQRFCAAIFYNRDKGCPRAFQAICQHRRESCARHPLAPKTTACPSMSGQKSVPCSFCPYNAAAPEFVVLQIHAPRSAFIWSCCHCPAKEDATSPLPHLSCQASACPYHPCLPIQRCRQYNSLSLYFHCLPFKGCRIPCSQSLWTLISFSR